MKDRSSHLGSGIAGKEDAASRAANPAAREMIEHLGGRGIETLHDRLEAQQPQCGFGSRGVCCSMCQWGPCRITPKSPRGVCGRDLELVAAANLLRGVAGGTSAQSMHARDLMLTLRAVAAGEMTVPEKHTRRLRDVGNALNVSWSWSPMDEVAEKVAEVMLDDLGRLTDAPMRTLAAFAPKERRALWEELNLLPRSAAFEVLEAMHMTTLGACSDWEAMIRQSVRTALAYAYSGLVTSSVLTDALFGIPEPKATEVNYGILREDHVNVLVHGHSPVMLEKVLEKIASEEIQTLAREKGAAGIVVGGMCCSGHEALGRHGVPSVSGALGQELVVGTGAVDAVVVDMQCVLPGLQAVAECFGTEIVTTCSSNRVPGATHVPFDPERPETLDEDAMRVARIAVEAFAKRDRSQIHIPNVVSRATSGFSQESVLSAFGGVRKLLPLLQTDIRGIVAMVGCSTPKAGCETSHDRIARELVRQGVLVLTSGCSAHALLNAGLCATNAAEDVAPGLRAACLEAGLPPALVVGSCSDNTRIIQVFGALAHEARLPLPAMPFVASGPELGNEKTLGQALAVMAHGVTVVVGLTPRLPIPVEDSLTEEDAEASGAGGPEARPGGTGHGGASAELTALFRGESGLFARLGSRLVVQPDPARAAATIVRLLDEKREALGWAPVDRVDEASASAV